MAASRRSFLLAFGAAGLGAACTHPAVRVPDWPRDTPFRLGVASGYPRPDGFVLWTRLVVDPARGDGGMPAGDLRLTWEVAEDAAFGTVVARGDGLAEAAWGHSVHVEVRGLAPGRWYWYRFRGGSHMSPVARTRTAPAAGTAAARLRFGFASCQMYEQGHFSAHGVAARDDLDLMLFLGDYIYESSWGRDKVRFHSTPEPYALDGYRVRYAQYKSDPDLMAAHHAMPWVLTWDDHEVDNDYANDRPEDGMARADFLRRRAAAYQAFYEHQPLPHAMRPRGPDMRIHTRFDWGAVASFFVLDGRQYRDHQVCPTRAGGSTVVDPAVCTAIADPARSMLGREQEAWLSGEFARSRARWNIVAQQTLMAPMDRATSGGPRYWTDGWDGYPAARGRLVDAMLSTRLANPVVIGGDVHTHMVADLRREGAGIDAPVVASEFVCNGITSQGPPAERLATALRRNPHLKFARSEDKGYVRVEIGSGRLTAAFVGMETVKRPDAPARVIARYAVEDGRPGAVPV